MKRKHREAMRAHADRQWDWYIDPDLDEAVEAKDWHDTFTPPYEASTQPSHHLDETLPF
jgi:hypothetical protein